ncbi:DUF6982 domain-containing protein [Terriglobus roseus]|uniref:Uncharacterized protein n=1 Tax=Terriglobus roseus TaxID=392734 RepID=A0A1H4IW07_9BACT|nr:hypothetical protein [Terriglobus roseus]SEB37412.1 hypothetical protein SAMN05443244_0065 [Terriglobus roseus]
MALSRKKVVVRRFLPGLLWGYLPASGLAYTGEPPMLDLLDLSGRIQPVPLADVKYAAYVRDFNTGDTFAPERLTRKTFLARPRSEGLWLRLTLRDREVFEGLAPLDLTMADGWAQDLGVHLVPPDIRGNTQRLFIPRLAIESMEVLAVVTTPSRKKPVAVADATETQPDLFSLELPPDARTQ